MGLISSDEDNKTLLRFFQDFLFFGIGEFLGFLKTALPQVMIQYRSNAMKPNSNDLPEEVFHAVAALVPRLIYVAEEECGVDPIELLVLWHIRHFGKPNSEGQNVVLRHDLTRVLKQNFHYSDANVSKLIEELQEKGFVLRATLSARERGELFGDQDGSKLMVLLRPLGDAKIEQFKAALRSRFDKWSLDQSSAIRLATRKFLPVVIRFARWLVAHYEPEREALLYPESTTSSGLEDLGKQS
ncbi:MAG TPA: helix-turn-helix domain-containing protein [Candidatus Sulfotelmatobacter sp.]|jgi:DNA-binding MarR family transcriptional regulator|nr:helix-turn-helix domain-containing protein [Candidatus Sulfotelmatobacter sp.]